MSERRPIAVLNQRDGVGHLLYHWCWEQSLGRFVSPRALVIAVPMVWLLVFFVIPFLFVFKISLATPELGMPPYEPLWQWSNDGQASLKVDLRNLLSLVNDSLYATAYFNSLKTAAISTVLCLLLGYPMAYGMARSQGATRNLLLMLVILPFWTSFLIRVYAWIGLLQSSGPLSQLVNGVLVSLHLVDEPIPLLYTNFSVYLGIVYSYLPFMILPLYATLEKMDLSLLEAASDLGCKPTKAFFLITLPLSMPGVIAGSMLVFIPAVGEFVIPELLGGKNSLMIGRLLWFEFFNNNDWPRASALAIAILVALIVPITIYQHYQAKDAGDA